MPHKKKDHQGHISFPARQRTTRQDEEEEEAFRHVQSAGSDRGERVLHQAENRVMSGIFTASLEKMGVRSRVCYITVGKAVGKSLTLAMFSVVVGKGPEARKM